MTTTWLYVVMVCVATHRATRLVTRDDFPPILWLRTFVVELSTKRHHWLADLITCPWCAGVWLAAGITWATDRLVTDGLPGPVLVWATAAAVAGWLGRADDDGDGEAAFNSSHNTTPPRATQQMGDTYGVTAVTERMPTRRMNIRSRDALMGLGMGMLGVGMILVLGIGLALMISGVLTLAMGALRAPAKSESLVERVRKAA